MAGVLFLVGYYTIGWFAARAYYLRYRGGDPFAAEMALLIWVAWPLGAVLVVAKGMSMALDISARLGILPARSQSVGRIAAQAPAEMRGAFSVSGSRDRSNRRG
jgi:hypothetical protein